MWAELYDGWRAERPVATREGGILGGSDGGILPGALAGTCPGVCQWWVEPTSAPVLGGGGAAAACEAAGGGGASR